MRRVTKGKFIRDGFNERDRLPAEELALRLGRQSRRLRIVRKVGNFLAFTLVLLVGAAIWWYVLSGEPDHPPTAVENMLVSVGLKSPPPPVYRGNPDVRVWIDVHTALYYCRGDERFGKTPGGRVDSQHDAQGDHFQPASATACEEGGASERNGR